MSRKSVQRRNKQPAQTPQTPPATSKKLSPRTKKVLYILGGLLGIFFIVWSIYAFSIAILGSTPAQNMGFNEISGITLQSDGTAIYDGNTYTAKDNMYTVLFIGIDRSDERLDTGYATEDASLADTLIVANIDLTTSAVSLISIPRDTMVNIYTYNTEGEHNGYITGQIAMQYAYGGSTDEERNQHMLEAVERLLNGLEIDAYVTIDMDDIITATDLMGGISVYVPDDEYYCAYTGYEPGQWVMLDGEAALQFVQYRDTEIFASCELRVERQKTFLDGAINHVYVKLRDYPLQMISIAKEMYEMIDISIPFNDCMLMATKLLSIDMYSIKMETVSGEVAYTDSYEEYYVNIEAMDLMLLDFYYDLVE